MNPGVVLVAGIAGALLGPVLRGQIFHHSVPSGQPRRYHCPQCAEPLGAFGRRTTVAVLPPSGSCPHCHRRIGPFPGVVEGATAAVLSLAAWRTGAPFPLLALCWVGTVGVILGFVDVAVHRLPDRLTLASFTGACVLLTLAAVAHHEPGRLGSALAGALGVTACYLVLTLISPAGMGFGDAKAALSAGIVTGWYGWAVALAGAATGFLLAGGYAAALLVLRKAGRKDHLPHGPFLLLGALAAILLN